MPDSLMVVEFRKSLHPEITGPFFDFLDGSGLSDEDKDLIRRATLFADNAHGDQRRKSGEIYMIHPIAVARILMEIGMDAPTIAAGVLHDVLEDTRFTYADLKNTFSSEIVRLVDGVTKIKNLNVTSKADQESLTIRKMFFAMVDDPRVIIIKLSDKLHNMRTLDYLELHRAREIANECLEIFAPLADRLGMNMLKTSLEDEAFKVLNPKEYEHITRYINDQRQTQENFLRKVESEVRKKLDKRKILLAMSDADGVKDGKDEVNPGDYSISTRIKGAYSIYQKMRRKRRTLGDMQDLYGMRILCRTTESCYAILGIVHGLWPPVEGRVKDYIATPKSNNYQSLHTTVLVKKNKRMRQLEVQIRTFEMDAVANFGVASHWAYKAQTGREGSFSEWKDADDKERFLKFMERMRNWKEEIKNSDDFMNEITGNLLKDTIIVLTPKGKPIELPLGSTALDFAYSIHTEIGNRCHMAKANGSIISLSAPLRNNDVVEIITSPSSAPRENWLKYAYTQSARRKIKSYLNKHDANMMFGENVVVKGLGKAVLLDQETRKESEDDADGPVRTHVEPSKNTDALSLSKNEGMKISFAKCCHPVKGDPIIGYISRGRGVIVHRRDCPNVPNMTEFSERQISVSWDYDRPSSVYEFRVEARHTKDLFGEIGTSAKNIGGNLLEGRLDMDDGVIVSGTFKLEVPFNVTMAKVERVVLSSKHVKSIKRLSSKDLGIRR